jgi:hypothetical protein
MNRLRTAPAVTALVAVLVAAVAFLAAELAAGATHRTVEVRNPCAPRPLFPGHGIDATIQRVVLDGLDGAACRLHTTRERLVLSLRGTRRWDRHTIEVAVRAGTLRAVDEAVRRGDIPGFLAPLARRLVRTTPLDKLIQGGLSLGGLIG